MKKITSTARTVVLANEDLLGLVLGHLDVMDLISARAVNRVWRSVTSSDRDVWACAELDFATFFPPAHPASKAMATNQRFWSALKTLPYLRAFRVGLDGCPDEFTDTHLAFLVEHCPRLTGLFVEHCPRVTFPFLVIPPTHLSELTSVQLSDCVNLKNASVMALAQSCPRLTFLDLSFSKMVIDDTMIEVAQLCPELREVQLNGCTELTDVTLLYLGRHCLRLSQLGVDWCDAMRACPCGSLTSLSCKGWTEMQLASVTTRLRSLDLSQSPSLTLTFLCPRFQRITRLKLSGCRKLTDDGILDLTRHCRTLTDLSVDACPLITDLSIAAVARAYRNALRSLAFGDWDVSHSRPAPKITDSSLRILGECCPELRRLELSWTVQATDEGMTAMVKGCTQLEYLSLFGSSSVTNDTLQAIAECRIPLTELHLRNVDLVTDRGMDTLARRCPTLQSVSLAFCWALTADSLHSFCRHCPRLHTLHAFRRHGFGRPVIEALQQQYPDVKISAAWE